MNSDDRPIYFLHFSSDSSFLFPFYVHLAECHQFRHLVELQVLPLFRIHQLRIQYHFKKNISSLYFQIVADTQQVANQDHNGTAIPNVAV